ncbi:MAG: GNAT family N-acetyltransferase [Gemmatimonadetes bacterium]|nr:GNAT family N-acetyltransferase [Gemmatimonadota bacterium]NIQ57150.1 GNAT family N-acetyltransferase [Gemmatimonadota bacterium]NIU77325.1 GNAT family N-acetyltransferase [Gammaproteobacteria bacterium]NIX46586.1 GNAT family N-acetyltransferase [Gemmatimonadota bacterium]NIY10910.1 GNAT family N-acetyltransferase [Gemmatimonadota bacterium]
MQSSTIDPAALDRATPAPLALDRAPPAPGTSLPATLTLRDGTVVVMRPLVPGDRPLIAAFLEGLSPRSRYLRFCTPMPRIDEATVTRMSSAEPGRDLALVVLDGRGIIATGRLARHPDDPRAAELALTVADEHQRRGLGRALITALGAAAVDRGIQRLTFWVAGENTAMLGLLRSLGARLRAGAGGVAAELPAAVPGAPGPGRDGAPGRRWPQAGSAGEPASAGPRSRPRCVSRKPPGRFSPNPRARSSPIWAAQMAAGGRAHGAPEIPSTRSPAGQR